MNCLLAANMRIIRAGPSPEMLRSIIGLPLWIRERIRHMFGLPMRARGLWYITGFETSIVAERDFRWGTLIRPSLAPVQGT